MGYMRHHAIVCSCWDEKIARAVRDRALQIFPPDSVSNVVVAAVNGYWTFLVGPDGSKEGWEESSEGDVRRAEFLKHLESFRYGDGSSPLDWVEIQYGDDERETVVVSHSDERAATDEELAT